MNNTYWVLDTETTGFDPKSGHKVIEIGAVKVIDGEVSDQSFQYYVDPQREIPEEAVSVHNLTREDVIELGDGKIFSDIAQDLIQILDGEVLVAHNAKFDTDFLDYELEAIGLPAITEICEVVDSLQYARTVHPSGKNNLDVLAKKYGVDNTNRDYHGALLDANILAQTFIAMTKAQKHVSVNQMVSSMQSKRVSFTLADVISPISPEISATLPEMKVSDADNENHKKYLNDINDDLSW